MFRFFPHLSCRKHCHSKQPSQSPSWCTCLIIFPWDRFLRVEVRNLGAAHVLRHLAYVAILLPPKARIISIPTSNARNHPDPPHSVNSVCYHHLCKTLPVLRGETWFLAVLISVPLIIPLIDHVFICFFYGVTDLSCE